MTVLSIIIMILSVERTADGWPDQAAASWPDLQSSGVGGADDSRSSMLMDAFMNSLILEGNRMLWRVWSFKLVCFCE